MPNAMTAKPPLHLWIVGIASLLWNAMGAFDYTMSHVKGAEYLRQSGMGDAAIAWFDGIPAWSTAAWALGVWGALAGSILLLMRSRHAVAAFAVSLLGVALMTVSAYVVYPYPPEMMSGEMTAFEWTIKIVAVLLLVYAIRMRGRGVLR